MSSPSNVRVATSPSRGSRLVSLLTLHRTRAILRSRRGRWVATSIGVVYGFVALLAGYMLQIVPTGASGTSAQVLTNSYSPAWWNYPAVLVVTPGGILVLPFLATVSMVLVSIGVGVGMGAGILLAARFFRTWKLARAGRGLASPLAGLTPAMVALLTLGACCSTSAAAAGSIGAIAEVSGTSYDQILLNSWILNVFQVAVLGIALIAQEYLIGVFSNLAKSGAEPKLSASERAARSHSFRQEPEG
ncbi:MAG TPA: hypothetical protein VJ021_04570 [Thermoplasmata archaeon]|nr:hypothetical protein [Thermoplasmata archaeon]